jgi:CRISPR-associated protein Cas1
MTDPLRIGIVAHHAFCPRRAWLEVNGEQTDTGQVAQGLVDHDAVDDPATSRGATLRAVEIHSDRLGLAGRCDTIELDDGDGAMTVVEHKAAPVRRSSDPTLPQRVQLALQALCLRERGHHVRAAAIWFSTTRRRVPVELDDDLMALAIEQVALARAVAEDPKPPPPLEDDPRCGRCSHVGVCLPDEHRERVAARRIAVSDPVGRVLHLSTPGSRASLRRGQIVVRAGDVDTTVPFEQVAGLVVHGNADVSAALLRETLDRGYPVVWCAWSGKVVGWATPVDGPNGHARRRQHLMSEQQRLAVAQAIVGAKIRNQAALLRRRDSDVPARLRTLAKSAVSTQAVEALLGLEGRAAALYFPAFASALHPAWATMTGRVARPARDNVNAALNVAYALLLSDVLRSIVACGLDPAGGMLHSAGRNKPALALDLMEEFRAPVADSAVAWAINNGELGARDFRRDLDAVRLTPRGRKALIAAYERRASTELSHPHFGYRVTWRRAMEVQARMFLALALDEIDRYRPIELR